MLTIVLQKWRGKDLTRHRVTYTAEHVNRVISMVGRNLSLPHRFVCLTDDPAGVECETKPIPAPDLLKYGACWHRLWLFSPEAKQLGDLVVSIDLDTVITDRIDPVLSDLPPFKIWGGCYPNIAYCGSLWALQTGAFPWVWNQFRERLHRLCRSFLRRDRRYAHPDCLEAGHTIGSDQAWMALMLPNMPTWTAADGVLSYRRDAKGELPVGARIVNFHGPEDPTLPQCQLESPWIAEHYH